MRPIWFAVLAACGGSTITHTPTNDGACIAEGSPLLVDGRTLVGCGGKQCYAIDPATGALSPHARPDQPDIGERIPAEKIVQPHCFEGYCWDPPADGSETPQIARNPDGKRLAIGNGQTVFLFDVATKKQLTKFDAPLSNMPNGLWFVGETVLVSGTDAGPYAVIEAYTSHGKHVGEFTGYSDGAVSFGRDRHIVIDETWSTTVTVIDPATGSALSTRKRPVPSPPADCEPTDPTLVDTAKEDPGKRACLTYYNTYYLPYDSTSWVDDGKDLVAISDRSLVRFDEHFVESSRVKLATCPKDSQQSP
ncbi:MAG TPA: hypothetical protein VGC41_23585 [Kofleriaceae bacterium]